MNELELRNKIVCGLCGRKATESGLPLFYRVRVERWGILMDAVRRQSGLEMMLGGHVSIAQAMGPDEDMARPVMRPVELTVCEPCAMRETRLAFLVEAGEPVKGKIEGLDDDEQEEANPVTLPSADIRRGAGETA